MSKVLEKPAVKHTLDEVPDENIQVEMCAEEFRGFAARADELSQDHLDMQYAAEEACRRMAGGCRHNEALVSCTSQILCRL